MFSALYCRNEYELLGYWLWLGDNVKAAYRTLRGGSALVQAHECRSAFRGEAAEDGPDDSAAARFAVLGDFGVRVVCMLRPE